MYEKLAGAFSEDLQVMYLQKVEEISPNIRYCAYNIGDESALRDLQNMRLKSGEDQLTSKLDVCSVIFLINIMFNKNLTVKQKQFTSATLNVSSFSSIGNNNYILHSCFTLFYNV